MKKQKAMPAGRQGFTLIELLVVISIIALISSIVLVSVKSARDRARIAAGLQFSSSVHHALGAEAVGIWDFNEGSGTTANDSSGYNNHGTINGATWVQDTPSDKGYALSFDGSNDYVETSGFVGLASGGTVTISAWVKPTLDGTQNIILDRSVQLRLEIAANNQPRAHFGTGGSWCFTSILGGNIKNQDWVHLVVTYNNSAAKIYVDGKLKNTYPFACTLGNSGNVNIGRLSGGGNYFPGLIDDVRIYAEALSQAQVKALYAEGAAKHEVLAERE